MKAVAKRAFAVITQMRMKITEVAHVETTATHVVIYMNDVLRGPIAVEVPRGEFEALYGTLKVLERHGKFGVSAGQAKGGYRVSSLS
jgi:hypothetical protein